MIARPRTLRATASHLRSTTTKASHRQLHYRIVPPAPPAPTPFVPDTTTFLTLIGRKLSQHAAKINSWSALFNLTSRQLKDLGIEPARNRRYLLRWREKFRRGDWGVGGDMRHVKDAIGRVRLCDVPVTKREGQVKETPATMTKSSGHKRMILNLPDNAEEQKSMDAEELANSVKEGAVRPVAGIHMKGAGQIYGPRIELVKGTNGSEAVLRVQEGLWEHRRGHKVDGGERRKAEVRSKRRAAERKAGKA